MLNILNNSRSRAGRGGDAQRHHGPLGLRQDEPGKEEEREGPFWKNSLALPFHMHMHTHQPIHDKQLDCIALRNKTFTGTLHQDGRPLTGAYFLDTGE